MTLDFKTQCDVANSLVGIPYAELGRSDIGVDCWGLVCLCSERLGLRPPPDPMVARTDLKGVARAIDEGCSLYGDQCEPKDLAIVFPGRGRRHFHAGFAIAGGILHAKSSIGVIFVERRNVEFANSRYYDWSS